MLLHRSRRRFLLMGAVSSVLAATSTVAQQPATSNWDVTKPLGQTREIDFTVSEGTWTSLDVSPDGTWIVFDLLGHIYRVPITGGTAECLTQSSGIAINVQPRVSPDGEQIAFISDRKGQMNVWVMDADGKNPTPVLLDNRYEYRWPGWTSDNRFVFAVKRPPFTVPGFGSLTLLSRDGGNGIELLRGEAGRNPFRASVSADGRFVYYDNYTSAPNVGRGRTDALRGAVQLHRLDLATGLVTPITAGETEQGNADHPSSGGGYAAEPSPDGRYLAFMRKVPGGTLEYKGQRYGPRSALWIRDLTSGSERLVMDPVEMDQSETSFPLDGTYPAYKWMPDSKSIVIHQGGQIRRVDVTSGIVATIPFSARVQRVISEQPWFKTPIADGPVDVNFIRWASAAPDGKTLAFQAIGRIWLMDLPNGTPRRLTPDSFAPHEFHPAWSPDGRTIAFTTWDDERRGALWVADTRGSTPRRLTQAAGEYANPAWTPDGSELVVSRGAGATARGQTLLRNPYFDLVRVPIDGGEERFVVQVPRSIEPYSRRSELLRATVGTNGRIYFYEIKPLAAREGERAQTQAEVTSLRPDGSDRIVHARITNAGDVSVSPNGRWVAYSQGMNDYLAPLPASGAANAIPTVDRRGSDLPAIALSREGGIHPRWGNDNVVTFVSGDKVITYDATVRRADTVTVNLSTSRSIARGSIAFVGARIIPLNQQPVIENGSVVVRAGRITCVGRCATAGVDRIINASGKTIIPGFVDVHAHHDHGHLGMMPKHHFESAVYLAYGVTTTFDPSPTSNDPFSSAQLIEAGEMIGPRMYSSGETFTFGDDVPTGEISSLDDALRQVARRKLWGAPMIKQYLQPTRHQRQWVVQAARQHNIRATAEGSADLYHRISMILDGHTGGEHLSVQAPLYGDVLTLMAKARYVYSHTPLVAGASAWNEEYFWQEGPALWLNTKLQRWIPWRELIPHTRRFTMRPATDYTKDVVAQTVTDLIALGGYSAIGSHGQQHGLGSHWDVWMLAKAAGAMRALEVASMHGAIFLGMEDHIGSLSVGKLGDLMVLNSNPLTNIRNTADIQYVMKGGVLYDANSLDEVWPRSVPYGNYYWVVPEMFRVDEKRIDTRR